MHGGTDGVLIEWRGHTLTVLEWHSIVYGAVGFLVGLSEEIGEALRNELPYVLGSFIVTYLIGRALRSD